MQADSVALEGNASHTTFEVNQFDFDDHANSMNYIQYRVTNNWESVITSTEYQISILK